MQYCHFVLPGTLTTPVTILHNNPPAVSQSLQQISIELMKHFPLPPLSFCLNLSVFS